MDSYNCSIEENNTDSQCQLVSESSEGRTPSDSPARTQRTCQLQTPCSNTLFDEVQHRKSKQKELCDMAGPLMQ
ncbi:hypothetical protein EYF80_001876 [Liparis tanakae]|uniref:Uncharacterized protein n=1 Tax=Liparis tanakae TaxID=230148 RepID=A0A4Z2JF64_9TELE|nr:hypothetical protein EYF80_001876 [Liparis tanakae]